MKNKISKIAIFTILMLNGTVKSQEFYTCIPNEDWVKGKAKEAVTDTHIQELIRKTVNKLEWKKIIHLTPNSNLWEFEQTLQPGRYRVKIAAAGSKEIIKDFTLTTANEFRACVGIEGTDGGGYKNNGGGGGGAGGGGIGYNGYYGDGEKGVDGGVRGGNYQPGKGGKPSDKSTDGNNGSNASGGGNNGANSSRGGGAGGGGGGGSAYGGRGGNGDGYMGMLGRGGAGGYDSSVDGGSFSNGKGGEGGQGCCGGGGGGGGGGGSGNGGGGGGGGSYFVINGIVGLILKGGRGEDGKFVSTSEKNIGGKGAGPDGYVIIEKLE